MENLSKNMYMSMLLALLIVTTFISCSKWDDFKKYTAEGEVVYSGKLDSAKVYAGKNRVRITGWLSADPKLESLKVLWDNKTDSVVFPINGISGNTFFDKIIENVDEGVKTFTIITSDADGNSSVPVNISGVSYGNNYRKRLTNRFITNLSFAPTSTTINWDPMDLTTGAQYTEVDYEVGGEKMQVVTPAASASSVLEGLNVTTPIKYRTIFKPEPTSIDTFAVSYTDFVIKVVPQLKNREVPFIASATSGRWGNLADWNSNDAVKNHDGFGGWDEWNDNIFNIESGWGSPPVINGKIWQTLTLDPGSYTFEISDLMNTNLTEQDNAYLVVAAGSGLPNVENVSTALGYVKIVEGKPTSAYRIQFTVTQAGEISLGYLTSQPDGWPGRFCNIRAFNFYAN